MIVSIKHAALAATALSVAALGSSAMAASAPSNAPHHLSRISSHHTKARTPVDDSTGASIRASDRMASLSKTPPTIQQGLSMVGSIWGPQGELLARSFLTAHGYPTQGGITPALAQDIASSLAGIMAPASRPAPDRGIPRTVGRDLALASASSILPMSCPPSFRTRPISRRSRNPHYRVPRRDCKANSRQP